MSSPESDMLCRLFRTLRSASFFLRRLAFSIAPACISPRPGLLNLFFIFVVSAIIALSLRRVPGRCLEGLDLSLSAPGKVDALALSNAVNPLRLLLISGVASLSSLGSGDRGVSPAEESSKSSFGFRGVLNSPLKAGTPGGMAGRGFVGEDCWLPIVLDFEGESNPLCGPTPRIVSLCTLSHAACLDALFLGVMLTLVGIRWAFPLSCAKGERPSSGPVRLSNWKSIGDSCDLAIIVCGVREVGRG